MASYTSEVLENKGESFRTATQQTTCLERKMSCSNMSVEDDSRGFILTWLGYEDKHFASLVLQQGGCYGHFFGAVFFYVGEGD